MCWFVVGFILGVGLEYWLQGQTVEPRHIREAEDVAETAWDTN